MKHIFIFVRIIVRITICFSQISFLPIPNWVKPKLDPGPFVGSNC